VIERRGEVCAPETLKLTDVMVSFQHLSTKRIVGPMVTVSELAQGASIAP